MDSVDQQIRANKIFQVIKDFSLYFPEEFEKCDIKLCGHCGNGFTDKHLNDLCTRCGGIGYVGFVSIMGEFICRTCNGYGCDECDRYGIVDWIKHARGTDIRHYKRPRNYR